MVGLIKACHSLPTNVDLYNVGKTLNFNFEESKHGLRYTYIEVSEEDATSLILSDDWIPYDGYHEAGHILLPIEKEYRTNMINVKSYYEP